MTNQIDTPQPASPDVITTFTNLDPITWEDNISDNDYITWSAFTVKNRSDGGETIHHRFVYYSQKTAQTLIPWRCPYTRAEGEAFKCLQLKELKRHDNPLYEKLITEKTLKENETIQKENDLKELLIISTLWRGSPTPIQNDFSLQNNLPLQDNNPIANPEVEGGGNRFSVILNLFLERFKFNYDENRENIRDFNKKLSGIYNIIPKKSSHHFNQFNLALDILCSPGAVICYGLISICHIVCIVFRIFENIIGLFYLTMLNAFSCFLFTDNNDLVQFKDHAVNIVKNCLHIAELLLNIALIIGSPLPGLLQLFTAILTGTGEILFKMYRGIHNIFRSKNAEKIAAFNEQEQLHINLGMEILKKETLENDDDRNFVNNSIKAIVKERHASFKNKHLSFFGQSRSSGEAMKIFTSENSLEVKHNSLKSYLSDVEKNGKKDLWFCITKALKRQPVVIEVAVENAPAP